MPAFAVRDGEYILVIHAGATDSLWLQDGFIKLGAKMKQWSKGYTAVEHSPHSPVGQHHVHVYVKGKYLFALNADGTAHDRSHGTRIPNYVAEKFGLEFSDYILPPGLKIASKIEVDTYYGALRHEMREAGDIETDKVFLLELPSPPSGSEHPDE